MAKQKKDPTSGTDARAAILRAAQRHWAEHGLGPSSVRAIAKAAGVNSALLRYYFGPKEALFRELASSVARTMCTWRLSALEKLRQQHGGAIPLADIVRAYVELLLIDDHPLAEIAKVYLRCVGQTLSEPQDHLAEYMHSQFLDAHRSFIAEFARSAPHVGTETIAFRFQMMRASVLPFCSTRESGSSAPLLVDAPFNAAPASDVIHRFCEEWGRIFSLTP
jgi:AcrR family transcriptional regulator